MTTSSFLLAPLLPFILPSATRWVRREETAILAAGQPLTGAQLADARRAGVARPEKIRLQFIDPIPLPGPWLLRELGIRTGLVGSRTAGITLGYGIYVRTPFRHDRELAVHEFVHVGQYERLGSIAAFLRAYLRECLDPGYPRGPLEQEAIHAARRIVRGPAPG
jgi:hypothetical protein